MRLAEKSYGNHLKGAPFGFTEYFTTELLKEDATRDLHAEVIKSRELQHTRQSYNNMADKHEAFQKVKQTGFNRTTVS